MPRITVEPGRLTLATAPRTTALVVMDVHAEPNLARRLGTLGLRQGSQVEILHRASGGGLVIAVAGARLALARSVLESVDVS